MRSSIASSLASPVLALAWLWGAAVATGCGTSDNASAGPDEQKVCGRVVLKGGGGVPTPEDGSSSCTPGDCNYQTQQGCAEDQSCRPKYAADSETVSPGCEPAGNEQSGGSCETSVDCARGFLCVEESPGIHRCRRQCCAGDWSACAADERCIRQFYVSLADGRLEHVVDLCFPVGTCDLFDVNACANEQGRECKIVDPTGAVACAPRSSAKLGDLCAPPDVCSQGLTCVRDLDASASHCRRLCRAEQCGEPSCPAAEGSCVHFDRDPPGVGECTPNR